MYHNRNIYSAIKYKIGNKGILLFLFLTAVCLILLAYVGTRRVNDTLENNSLIRRYTHAIKTYLNNTQQGFSLEDLEANVRSFKFNDELFVRFKWKESASEFNSMLNDASVLLLALLKPAYHRSEELWRIIIFSNITICSKFNTSKVKRGFPWGENWYVFSITYPRFLVFSAFLYRAQFNRPHREMESWLKIVIPYLIASPTSSLGYARDGANAIMMTVPWLGAHILLNNYARKSSDPGYKYVLQLLKADYVTKGEGFYHRGGYITHTHLRGYGYLDGSLEDVRLITVIVADKMFNLMDKMLEIRRLLDNPSPTVMRQFGPLHTRTSSLNQKTHVYGSYGFDIIASMRIVSVKQPTYTFQFMAQHPQFYYYEADRDNRQWVLYAVMARNYLYADSDKHIRQEFITYYPGVISIKNQPVVAEVDEEHTTTQGYLPNEANSIICKINDTCVAVYNRYFIDALNYPVEELMLVHEDSYTVSYTIPSTNETLIASLMLSINFGAPATTGDVDVRGGKGGGSKSMSAAIFKFKNNSSWIHTTQTPIVKQVKREEDDTVMQSLQCAFVNSSTGNASRTISFTTFHGSVPPGVRSVGKNHIITDRYKLYYYEEYLYLIDEMENRGTLARHLDEIPAILEIPSYRVKKHFGAESVMENLGTYVAGNSPKYVDIVDHGRLHSTFSNVTAKRDKEIRALLKSH